ncbi:MAG: PBP1A family penicillin-binding protein [Myxococcota bacterium]|nr:PBP1A family penicillin-binding protein [Myxococcota bacterium]
MSKTPIANPRSTHPVAVCVRIFFALGVAAILSLGLCLIGAYVHLSRDLPGIPTVQAFQPASTTVFHASGDAVVGRFATEHRTVKALGDLPLHLIQAFLAAEDKRFFAHRGVDWMATLRATLANFRAGRTVQGASTITQQLCKRLVGQEKSYVRKAKEAILARRMEKSLSKLDILYIYLNDIYLGHGAYGVQAAAEHYFRKDAADLDLAESAMLAGLPPQPSVINPVRDFAKSKTRQAYVLQRMVEEGFISASASRQAASLPLSVFSSKPEALSRIGPHFTEHARQYILRKYGEDALYRGGLKVFLPMEIDKQSFAESALRAGLDALGKRQGFRGPVTRRKTPKPLTTAEHAQLVGTDESSGPHRWRLARVVKVVPKEARVQLGSVEGRLLLSSTRWAKPYQTSAVQNSGRLTSLTDILRPGDWVWVSGFPLDEAHEREMPIVSLEQRPPVNGALVSIDPRTQAVVALVGGYDFDESEFNRITQACRQPGSIFKPIVFSQALAGRYTLASLLSDAPITVYDRKRRFLWKPKNMGGRFKGQVLLADALALSLNTPSIRLIDELGPDKAVEWARRLGLTSDLYADSALVLGSSCVRPLELTNAFSSFLTGGDKASPVLVKRVLDRQGRILEDNTPVTDVSSAAVYRIDTLLRRALETPDKVMDAADAYLMKYALRHVVRHGTAADVKRLNRPAGGKTGTTDKYDALFIGFTDELLTTVWVGSDKNIRALGRGETGGRNALPIWMDYMKNALAGRKPVDFTQPTPPDVVFRDIDKRTGLLARTGRPSVRLPFRAGTEPTDRAESTERVRIREVEHLEGRF